MENRDAVHQRVLAWRDELWCGRTYGFLHDLRDASLRSSIDDRTYASLTQFVRQEMSGLGLDDRNPTAVVLLACISRKPGGVAHYR